MNYNRIKKLNVWFLVIFNIFTGIWMSVIVHKAVRGYKTDTTNQNVENIETLTDSLSDRLEIYIVNSYRQVEMTSSYISSFNNNEGVTQQEACQIITELSVNTNYEWQIINSEYEGSSPNEKFTGVCIENGEIKSVSYDINYYSNLSEIFIQVSKREITNIKFTNEFTDPCSLNKTFGIVSPIRLKTFNNAGDVEYVSKSLMLVIDSEEINSILQHENEKDILNFEDSQSVIVNSKGDYVFSPSYFQGTNIFSFIREYDDSISDTRIQEIENGMAQAESSEMLYCQNNRGEKCIYVFHKIANGRWYVITSVPVSSFHNVHNYTNNYIEFFLAFILFFSVNIVELLHTNKRLRLMSTQYLNASEAKSDFLSSMSHDIRTPMNAIIGMTIVAKDKLNAENVDYESVKDCINTIETSGNHMMTLVNDILDISKIESGKIALSCSEYSIANSLSNLIEINRPLLKDKNIHFEAHMINLKDEYVYADELRINQTYINILSNAIKYTPSGGKIILDLIEEEIPGDEKKRRYTYRVKDNGIGMSKEFQEHVFDRFARAVDTRINKIQGTGLGMSITKQLVDFMGGTISVESELNKGSTFTIELDLPIVNKKENVNNIEGLDILMIDNDEVVLSSTEDMLKNYQISFDKTMSPEEGIELLLKRKEKNDFYDIVLIDWDEEGDKTKELLDKVIELTDSKSKIIVISSESVVEIEPKVKSFGAYCVLTKPLYQSCLVHNLSVIAGKLNDEIKKKNVEFKLDVLVAEDNEINYEVLSLILERYGIIPDHAENGQIAVDMLKDGNKKYDLVLMDIQMPIMNGIDATKAIRKLEDKEKASIPIYAMTANSFSEDVQNCIDAGMNGHLAKPIEIAKLYNVLNEINNKKHSS